MVFEGETGFTVDASCFLLRVAGSKYGSGVFRSLLNFHEILLLLGFIKSRGFNVNDFDSHLITCR